MSAFLILAFFVGGVWHEHALPVTDLKACQAILLHRIQAGAIKGPNEMIWCETRRQDQ